MTEIRGRTAVVTGGGGAIGGGIARALGKEGASVAVADMMLETAERVAEQIRSAGGTAVAVECDVCERDSIAAMKAKVNEALGPVQILFANAGATSFDPLMEMSDEDVDWILNVNMHGVMNTTRAFLPDMMEGREGHICATASMAGLLPGWIPVHVPYSAAKMGIIGMMMNLGIEMKDYNVETTLYCPGGVASNMKVNNATYRPAKFGGPGQGEVHVGEESGKIVNMDFFTPDAIAPMVLNAVRNNRKFVFDHPEQRKNFRETYAQIVEACYDDADAWFRENGKPQVNPEGPKLVAQD